MTPLDSVSVKLAVSNAIGYETITLKLDAILQTSLKVLTDRIAREIPMSRFSQHRPWPDDELVIVVPDGSYTSARKAIKAILTDIYRSSA